MKTRLALVLLAATVTPALAQSIPTEAQQRQACKGDAMRLCAADIPNMDRIRSCIISQHDQLSPPCRAVVDAGLRARAASRAPQQ
ncbi:hypothetical protein [Labrys monachus]|uniref:Uncharacterized protein involved in copper resistance n=1 Tax=Labrys monachus TaxID=217067 RepID=A0ABU0FJZ3_9HYPH|nr:hypothetical protein [Labrys monachus]MDQ0394927.1 uncharacterized protein involved in copper resistance [Labrys monachus]